jgi:hypothetical protein
MFRLGRSAVVVGLAEGGDFGDGARLGKRKQAVVAESKK